MSNPIFIVDLFQDVVDNVSYELNIQINYIYGNPYEINEDLVTLSKSKTTDSVKFPMIALFTDIKEEKGRKIGIYSEVKLHIIIADRTEMNLRAPERMKSVFKPVLQPIYDEFINQIAKSKYFSESIPELVQHEKTDRLYWGKSGVMGNSGLIFTDLLDCIEIENLVLNVKRKNC